MQNAIKIIKSYSHTFEAVNFVFRK